MSAFLGYMLACAIQIHGFNCHDFDLMCRCVQAEAGGESAECKEAVATVILNRLYCEDKFPDDISDIIYQQNQFVVAPSGSVTDETKTAVIMAMINWGTYNQNVPRSCYYFRAGHYPSFGIKYKHIDNTYFSLAENATD